MTSEEARSAIDAAIAAMFAEWDADENTPNLGEVELARFDALAPLRALSDEELEEHVVPLAASERVEERALVADVLRYARGREDGWEERARRYATTILSLAARETDATVLCACIAAFIDLGDPRGVELAVAQASHPDADVRHTVASTLGSFASSDARAVSSLLSLSRDPDDAVRDWATFGLAQCFLFPAQVVDPRVIRDALFARVDDAKEECRGEAWVGLAMARDPRVIPLIHDALAGRRQCWLALEAITEWPRREYVEGLATHRERWRAADVDAARAACEVASE